MQLNDLKLIAIHIQKTGGMAFKKLLQREYKRKYYRLNINLQSEDREGSIEEHLLQIPPDTQVIHGHFIYQDVVEILEASPGVPVVTWLRNPVDRVVSSYYFSKRKYEEGLRSDKPNLGELSLLEFANEKININQMSRVLKGISIFELGFVGCLEFLEEDLIYLSQMLNWTQRTMPRRNVNREYKEKFAAPTDSESAEIASLNNSDIEQYQAALALRKVRPVLSGSSGGG